MKHIKLLTTFTLLTPFYGYTTPYVTSHLMGQFGNQLFIMAAAISLALDNGASYVFPELDQSGDDPIFNIPTNRERVFTKFTTSLPNREPSVVYYEPEFCYNPIPYAPNTVLVGWFQSEKYFKHHQEEIRELFSIPESIFHYLKSTYSDVIENPHTVAVHMRTYKIEKTPEQQHAYVTYGRDYVERAMEYFSEDAQFIIFSNDMEWCKKELEGLDKKMRFIEGEPHYHDFYLMSLCRHQIICNSSFSWWAAYLNRNPSKRIIVPARWFSETYVRDTKDLIPPEWIILKE